MAFKIFNKIKKSLDPHFNYDEEFNKAVAEKNEYNEEQSKRFAKFCENFEVSTHNIDRYKKLKHEEQQEILTQVIEGIKEYPHVDDFHFGIQEDFQGAAKMEDPKSNGQYVKNPAKLSAEMEVAGAALWHELYGKKHSTEK